MDIADLWMLSCTGFGEVLKHVDLTKLIREGLERENLIPKSSNDATEHATEGEMKRNSGMTRNPTPKVLESVQNEKVVTSGSGLNAEEDAEVSSSGGKYASHERISGKTGTGSTEGLYYVSRLNLDKGDIDGMIQSLVTVHDDCGTVTPREGKQWEEFRAEQAEYRCFRDKNVCLQRDKSTDKSVLENGVISCNIRFFERRTIDTVRFAKHIPGFSDLDIADKILLIKESRQTCYLPSALRSCNVEEEVITLLPGEHFTFEEMSNGLSDEFLHSIFKYSSLNSQTNLTAEEETLVDAIVLTVPGPRNLCDRQAVEEIHSSLLRCLEHVVKKRGVPVGPRISQIMNLISELNIMTDTLLDYLKSVLINSPGHSTNRTLIETL